MDKYKVYVKTDTAGCIIDVNSDAFLTSFDNWIEIDSGGGDKYHHAQGNYFEKPLTDDRGIYRYATIVATEQTSGEMIHKYHHNGVLYVIYEKNQEEMDSEWVEPDSMPSQEDRIFKVESAVASLLSGVIDTQT